MGKPVMEHSACTPLKQQHGLRTLTLRVRGHVLFVWQVKQDIAGLPTNRREGHLMDHEMSIKVIGSLIVLWLGTLSFIWAKHLSDDKEKHLETIRRLQEQDGRIERALTRLNEAVKSIESYQTAFNLNVHGELASIKALLQAKIG